MVFENQLIIKPAASCASPLPSRPPASAPTTVGVAVDPGAHQLFPVQVDAPALGAALVALHLPVVAVLVAARDVQSCEDVRGVVKYLHPLHANTCRHLLLLLHT